MLPLKEDWREFIALLNSHQVRYLIVGAFAVGYHAVPRMTGDIDFFVEASEENGGRLETVLEEFGFKSLGLSANDFTQPDTIIQLGYPPSRIDLITSLSGAEFSHAWANRVTVEHDGLTLHFLDRDTLVANKEAAGRPKDLADLAALRRKQRKS